MMQFVFLFGPPLPEWFVTEIFLQLSGKSLHKCRQVSHAWNIFIVKNIWQTKYEKCGLENTLSQNKTVGKLKFVET